jgi:predicted PurR-regulated permease PerM
MLAFAVGLLPVLLDQARTLIERLPGAYSTFVRTVVPWLARWLPQDGLQAPADLGPLLPSAERILRGLFSGLLQIGRGLASAAQIGSFFLLTPILTYYLLVDFDRLRDGLRPHLPPAWAERGGRLAAAFQDSVSAWLKAQMLVALIVATLTIAGFALIGLPYALLLGFLAGLLNLVPVLGFWVGAFLAASAALFTPAPLPMLGKTALVLASVQLLEQNLLSPRIVGRRLGAKPVVLLLVMLLLSVFLGVAGVLLAAPVIGLARGIWEIWGPPTRAAAGSEP